MKILVAPNAMKGSLSASEAAKAMEEGIRSVMPDAEVIRVPVADGGDGLVDVFLHALSGQPVRCPVSGPRGDKIQAEFCFVPAQGRAAIEMAKASGLALLREEQRNPLLTTTYGTGQLIDEALRLGARKLTIGIGGSATNDGGIGMAAALGIKFIDENGRDVEPVGGNLGRIRRIDRSGLNPLVALAEIDVACDVDNPLTGPRGATRVYGPQKGADAGMLDILENGLVNLEEVIRRDCGVSVAALPGAGAAGGLGAGLVAFLGANLRKGIDLVFSAVHLQEQMQGADLVLTAEGQIDFQTRFGKAPAGVAAVAQAQGIPCVAIAGGIGAGIDTLHQAGITAVFSLCPGPVTLAQAMQAAKAYMQAVSAQILRLYLAGQKGLRA